MRNGKMDSFGREESACSRSVRRALREDRQACDRAPSRDSGFPLSESVSGWE